MSTLPSLPVIPEGHHHHHGAHSCSSLYPSGTMASTASGYLRVDGSVASCRSPIYETVSSNEGEQETMFGSGTPRRVLGNSNANGSNSGGKSEHCLKYAPCVDPSLTSSVRLTHMLISSSAWYANHQQLSICCKYICFQPLKPVMQLLKKKQISKVNVVISFHCWLTSLDRMILLRR